MNGLYFFILLPYLAMFSFIGGSIFRYRFHGFTVSSYSSQLLENKLLTLGSRPFHWSIITLFFGHLFAFLIPSFVLAWNGIPTRLYIIEIFAFSLGLTLLTSLIFLIFRRWKIKRIRVVTTRIDIFVYVILSFQILTGLYTAFFYRWGSSWFALVLTPYLRSVLSFKPDVTAIIALPLIVKIHISTAFILIGMIPYTRLMHFLVYPFAYLWREYQVVIWNKNHQS